MVSYFVIPSHSGIPFASSKKIVKPVPETAIVLRIRCDAAAQEAVRRVIRGKNAVAVTARLIRNVTSPDSADNAA